MRVGSIFKKALKFVKVLPKLSNYSASRANIKNRFNHLENLLLSTDNDYSTKKQHRESFSTKADFVRFENDEETISTNDLIFRSSSPIPVSSRVPSTLYLTNSSAFINTVTPSKTKSIPTTTKAPIASTSIFIPSFSKPFMQTYRINQTKRIPNQFASLKLNYDQSAVTKIDEVERGGKFQRLRVVPADTLIECKENDFGLECSCSITLSPPKCKQLINSFLSSCRILGCKNNGRCINMAYKYPSK